MLLDAIPEGAFVLSGPVPKAGVADGSVKGGVDDKTGMQYYQIFFKEEK